MADDEKLAARLGPVGIALPQVGASIGARDDVGDFAASAESRGFATLWTCELISATHLDPIALLAHAAARTRTAALGVAVVIGPLHQPLRLANQLATIDVLSGGRLVAGVGLGTNTGPYPRYGVSADRRLRRYLDGIDLLRRLWLDPDVEYANGIWELSGPSHVVRPRQRPHPPLLIGARQEEAVRRAARIGDGWVASGTASPEEFATALDALHRELDVQGRDPATFPVAKRVYTAISDTPKRDRERMRCWFADNYGNADLADRVGVVGSADQVTEHVADLHRRGAGHVLVNAVFDMTEQLDALAGALI